MVSEKVCHRCERALPLEAFRLSASKGHLYPRPLCRECDAAVKREKRASDPTKRHPARPRLDPASGSLVKPCSKCGETLPLDRFAKQRGGVRSTCKSCSTAAAMERYRSDPEKYRAQSREWAQRNPEKVTARRQRYKAEKGEELRAYWRMRHAARRDHENEVHRQYREAHREERREYMRQYHRRDPERTARDIKRRRALIKAAALNGPIDRQAIIDRDKSICYLCGRVLRTDEITLDHVVPLSKGGAHTADNLRVACAPCNGRKHAHLLSVN